MKKRSQLKPETKSFGEKTNPSMKKKSSGVKFKLPSEERDEFNFRLTGFEEVPTELIEKKKSVGTKPSTTFRPGQSIKKLDFNDLPNLTLLSDEIFRKDSNGLKDHREMLDVIRGETRRVAKLTEKKVAVPKLITPGSPHGETFLSKSPETLREELLKVGEKIKEDLEENIGFGFKPMKIGSKKGSTPGVSQVERTVKSPPNPSTMLDKSITSLQNRIQEQRKKFQEYQIGSLKLPSNKTSKLNRTQMELGKVPPSPKEPKNFFLRKKAKENAKLTEIARIFRASLEDSTRDPNDVIRIPGREKSPAGRASQNTKGTGVKRQSNVKPLLGKPTSVSSTDSKSKGSTAGFMDLRSLLESKESKTSLKPPKPPKPLTSPKLMDPLDFAKMKILELEEPQLGFKQNTSGKKAPSAQFADYLDAIEKEAEDDSSSRSEGAESKSQLQSLVSRRYPAISNEALELRLRKSVKTLEDAGTMAKNVGSLLTRVTASRHSSTTTGNPNQGMSSSSMSPTTPKSDVAELVQSFGLKPDIHAILNPENSKDQHDKLRKVTAQMDPMIQRAKNDERTSPKKHALYRQPKTTSSTGSGGSGSSKILKKSKKKQIEIQTDLDKSGKDPMRFEMPEIKFTKDMSEEDQRQLDELRAMKSKWEETTNFREFGAI